MPAAGRRAEVRELREQRERLMEQLQDLRVEGQDDRAAQVKEEIVRIDRQIAQRERAPSPGGRAREERREGSRPEGLDAERRQQHLREAVEHLHAAGLPDLAQQVAQSGQERLREPGRPRPGVPPEVVEELHAQLGELREAVRQLQGQVERLTRAKP